MREYGKTENLFERDPVSHKLITSLDYLKMPEVDLVDSDAWIATEKINGTNVRIIIRQDENTGPGFRLELKGRSDKANPPKDLDIWTQTEDVNRLWNELDLPDDVVVTFYGEAFGAGIQKGGMYSPDKRIAVFDLMTSRRRYSEQGDDLGLSHVWRNYAEFAHAAEILGFYRAPLVYADGVTIEEMVEDVRTGFKSMAAYDCKGTGGLAEGVVVRTSPYLFDGRGNRVMFKLKTEDLV